MRDSKRQKRTMLYSLVDMLDCVTLAPVVDPLFWFVGKETRYNALVAEFTSENDLF